MKLKETLRDFIQRIGENISEAGQFNIFPIQHVDSSLTSPHIRKDFYKVSLLTNAHGILSHADRSILIKGSALVFSNPMIPYSWESLSGIEEGWFCLFTEEFIDRQFKNGSLSKSPLFKVGGNPVLFPEPQTVDFLKIIYARMQAEILSDYGNKYDVLRSYVQIVMHESAKIEPPDRLFRPVTSSERISSLFMELLERQFPIPSERHSIRLKNANEFAAQLAIHTNHLNKALKEATGKTTSDHISDSMIREAKILLRNSHWSISSISHCLGFEHGANFNIFFKRQTGKSPTGFRKEPATIS
jgi:AraC family transcriptional regulator, transcriptional activator of pobA